MIIRQFEDKNLAHFSYAIISGDEIALVDPSRDPQPYYDLARQYGASIRAVIETHPHADFVSSHAEISRATGATVYAHSLAGADYPHRPFNDGDSFRLGGSTLRSIHTPGHSPDSISIVAQDELGNEQAVFTGDTLFIGDCGRPDLRETAGATTETRESLAHKMFHSLQKLASLGEETVVYPAHGAGSLCGKALSSMSSSTIGQEKATNWSLQLQPEDKFVESLLADQPFIPRYFGYNVAVNRQGAADFAPSVAGIPIVEADGFDTGNTLVIDTRPQDKFKAKHLPNAINLMDDLRFETWLGSIINPGEAFYLLAETPDKLKSLIARAARIGYEKQIRAGLTGDAGTEASPMLNIERLRSAEGEFTVIDIRNPSEVSTGKLFSGALAIPLYELREKASEIPANKPVVVHCAGGYRSAAGSSILSVFGKPGLAVYDLSETVKTFKNEASV